MSTGIQLDDSLYREKDLFLSSILGVNSYKITDPVLLANACVDNTERPLFEYARILPEQIGSTNALIDYGFYIVCQEFELVNNVERFIYSLNGPGTITGIVCKGKCYDEQLIDKFAGSFVYDRFSRDYNTKQFSKEIKKRWIRNIFSGNRKSDYLFYIAENNNPVGFVSAIKEGYRRARIELICIFPEYQGKGFGANLISTLCSIVDLDEVVVNTQASNHPAISLYKKMGFKMNQVYTVLHRFNKGDS